MRPLLSQCSDEEECILKRIQCLPSHFNYNVANSDPKYFRSRIDVLEDEKEFIDLDESSKSESFRRVVKKLETRRCTLLAYFYARLDEKDKAIEKLERIISKDPESIVARTDLSWLLLEISDLEQVDEHLEIAEKLYKESHIDELISKADIAHFHERLGPKHWKSAYEGFKEVLADTFKCEDIDLYSIFWKYEVADLIHRLFNKTYYTGILDCLDPDTEQPEVYLNEAINFLKEVVQASDEYSFMKARAWLLFIQIFNKYKNIHPKFKRKSEFRSLTPNGEDFNTCLQKVRELGIRDCDYFCMERAGACRRTIPGIIDLDKAEDLLLASLNLRKTCFCYNQLALVYRDKLVKEMKSCGDHKDNISPETNEGQSNNSDESFTKKLELLKLSSEENSIDESDDPQLKTTRSMSTASSSSSISTSSGAFTPFSSDIGMEEPDFKMKSSPPRSKFSSTPTTINRLIQPYPKLHAPLVEKILHYFEEAVKLTHETVPYYLVEKAKWSASLALTNGDEPKKQAIYRLFQKALSIKSNVVRNEGYAWETWGQFASIVGDTSKAEHCYQTAISLLIASKDIPVLSFNNLKNIINMKSDQKKFSAMAKLYEKIGDYPNAVMFLKESLKNYDDEYMKLEDVELHEILFDMAVNLVKMEKYIEADLLMSIFMQEYRDGKSIPNEKRSLYLRIKFAVLQILKSELKEDSSSKMSSDCEAKPDQEKFSEYYYRILQDVILRENSSGEYRFDFHIVTPESGMNTIERSRGKELDSILTKRLGVPPERCCWPQRTLNTFERDIKKQDAVVYIVPLTLDQMLKKSWQLGIKTVRSMIEQNKNKNSTMDCVLLVKYDDECPLDTILNQADHSEIHGLIQMLKCYPVFDGRKFAEDNAKFGDTVLDIEEEVICTIINARYKELADIKF